MSCVELVMFKGGFCSFPQLSGAQSPSAPLGIVCLHPFPAAPLELFNSSSPKDEILWHGNSNAVVSSKRDVKLLSKQIREYLLSYCLSKSFCRTRKAISPVWGELFHLASSLIKADANAVLAMFKMVADHDSFNLRPHFKSLQEMEWLLGEEKHVLYGQSICRGRQTPFKKKKEEKTRKK